MDSFCTEQVLIPVLMVYLNVSIKEGGIAQVRHRVPEADQWPIFPFPQESISSSHLESHIVLPESPLWNSNIGK